MSAVLRTPDLGRAVADYTGCLGFECQQHIPGVLALLRHGPLRVQLWACAAAPGRWERPGPSDLLGSDFEPSQHSVVVPHIHALHTSLCQALQRAGADLDARLPGVGPQLQPWGAWEFSLRVADGHCLHCVDWGVWRPDPSRLARFELPSFPPLDARPDNGAKGHL